MDAQYFKHQLQELKPVQSGQQLYVRNTTL